MKKKYQICGFIILFLCSVAYDFQKPEKIIETQEVIPMLFWKENF